MKTKAIFISLTIVLFLLLANMVLASQQIIWNPATIEVVLSPGIYSWEDDGVEGPYVMYDNGVYKMWYRGRGTKPNPTVESYEDAIGYATSTDGVNWSNRQLVYGSMPGYPQTKSPFVIKEGGAYRMWLVDYYEWIGGEWSGYVTHMDGPDGVTWHNQQKVMSAQGQLNPQGDGYNIESVCVLDEGSQYTMWYEVADLAAPYREKIWRATSTDGINWDNRQLSLPYGQETWEYRVKRPNVLSDGQGGYTMYYTVASEVGFWQLAMATSEDGITWNNRQLIGISGADPSYFEDVDGTPYLYFDEGGQIFRMSGNRVSDPTADAGPNQNVYADSTCTASVILDGSASSDPDEDIVSWQWFEGSMFLGSGETLSHAFVNDLGDHTITLVVTDSFGETDSDEVVICTSYDQI